MRRGRIQTVILAVPLQIAYGRRLASGAAERAALYGWCVRATHQPEAEFLEYLRKLPNSERRALGIVGALVTPPLIEYLRDHRIPAVSVTNQRVVEGLPRVISDDPAVGRLAARYFLNKGFRSFAFIGFWQHRYSEERCCGFAEELRNAGFDLRVCPAQKPGASQARVERERSEWLASLPPGTALLACNDILARQVAQLCTKIGIHIPDQIALLGVDDDEVESLLAGIPLSSVRPAFEQVGAAAVDLLWRLARGEPAPAGAIRIPPIRVVERRSTDHVAVEDPVLAKVLRRLRDGILQNLSIEQVARDAGVSVRGLQYRFRRVLGRSYRDIRCELRLEQARQMLLDTRRTISEIADLCGFCDVYYFSKMFRRHFGEPPSAYRAAAERPGGSIR